MRTRKLAEAVRARPAAFGIAAAAIAVAIVAGVRLAPAGETFALEQGGGSTAAAEDGAAAEVGAQVPEEPATVFVHVSGAVVSPGLYELAEGSRVAAAIEAAGGFAEGASVDGVNLARVVADGEQIVVPDAVAENAASASPGTEAAGASSLVNINTADADELDALPGVGPSTAEKIIADREANGPFQTPEDLKRVSGIGDKKYAEIEPHICV